MSTTSVIKQLSLVTAPATLLFLGIVGQVQAAFINNSNGINNPSETITFDQHVFPQYATITNQYSDLGVTFSPGLYYSPQTNYPNIVGNDLGNYNVNGYRTVPILDIFFNRNQTTAAFAAVTDGGNATFTALLNGVVVDSATTFTTFNSPNNFYGFSGITFNEIRFDPSQVTGGASALIDNLQLSPALASSVPEPSSTLSTFFFGVLGTGYLLKRKQKK